MGSVSQNDNVVFSGTSDWFVFNATRDNIGDNIISCMATGPGGESIKTGRVYVADDYWTNILYRSEDNLGLNCVLLPISH